MLEGGCYRIWAVDKRWCECFKEVGLCAGSGAVWKQEKFSSLDILIHHIQKEER